MMRTRPIDQQLSEEDASTPGYYMTLFTNENGEDDLVHSFTYSNSEYNHQFLDSLLSGSQLWTKRDEDRLFFLEGAIKDLKRKELRAVTEYNNKLDVFQRAQGSEGGRAITQEIRTANMKIRKLRTLADSLRTSRMRNASDRRSSPKTKKLRNDLLNQQLRTNKLRIDKLNAEKGILLLRRTRRKASAGRRANAPLARRLRELRIEIERMSRDMKQMVSEHSILRMTRKEFGGKRGGGGGGGGGRGVRKATRKKQAVSLLK